jgi:DNA-binding transcriptional LysR family regulator
MSARPYSGWREGLDTRLLQLTTRAVRLTEDGEIYLEAARAALDGLNEAEVVLSARRDEPVGRVRLDFPSVSAACCCRPSHVSESVIPRWRPNYR